MKHRSRVSGALGRIIAIRGDGDPGWTAGWSAGNRAGRDASRPGSLPPAPAEGSPFRSAGLRSALHRMPSPERMGQCVTAGPGAGWMHGQKKWPPGYPRGRCVGLAVGPASTRTIPEAAFRYRRGRRHDGVSEDRGRADTAARTGSRCRGPCRPRTPSPGRGRSRRFPPISVRTDRPDQASRS